MIVRHRRDLVHKMSALCCQVRECLHALMPGYAACFADLWASQLALPLARACGSAECIRQAGVAGLVRLAAEHGLKARRDSAAKIVAWAETAASALPQPVLLRQILATLDDDRLGKSRQIVRWKAALLTT